MPPTKVHSRKRKKRRFTGNQYTKKNNSSTQTVPVREEWTKKIDELSGDAGGVKVENFNSLPASQRKMETQADNSADEISESEGENLQGFRFVDISVVALVFELLQCPSYKRGTLSLEEDEESKMGLASLLTLKCSKGKCSFSHSFYTEAEV